MGPGSSTSRDNCHAVCKNERSADGFWAADRYASMAPQHTRPSSCTQTLWDASQINGAVSRVLNGISITVAEGCLCCDGLQIEQADPSKEICSRSCPTPIGWVIRGPGIFGGPESFDMTGNVPGAPSPPGSPPPPVSCSLARF